MAKGDPTWIPTAITAASTLFAAFLGALAVLLGSRRTSNQALQIAREQRRYERVHEMRAQTIPKMYLDLSTLMTQLRSLTESLTEESLTEREGDLSEQIAEAKLIVKHLDDVIESAQLNLLWFPSEVNETISTLTGSLQSQIARNWISAKNDKESAAGNKAFNEWLVTEGVEQEKAVARACRKALLGDI